MYILDIWTKITSKNENEDIQTGPLHYIRIQDAMQKILVKMKTPVLKTIILFFGDPALRRYWKQLQPIHETENNI